MDLGLEISKRIRELRLSKNLTQEELSEKIGWDVSFLGRIEHGKNTNLQINTIDKIIQALEIDYITFFTFENSSNRLQSLTYQITTSKKTNELLDIMEMVIDISEN